MVSTRRKSYGSRTPSRNPSRGRQLQRTPGGSTRKRSSSSYRSIATAVGNSIYPGAGTAAGLAYDVAKYAHSKVRSKTLPPRLRTSKGRFAGGSKTRYSTTGSIGGKFGKIQEKLKFTKHSNKGLYHVAECNGTVSDPDCVYLSHCAVDSYSVFIQATNALMRKLFEKAGLVITNIDELLVHKSIGNGSDWQVQLTQIDENTGVETVSTSYITGVTDTIAIISNVFFPVFQAFSSGGGTTSGALGNRLRLCRLLLYTQDYNTTYSPTFKCGLNLEDEIICVKGISKMKIQNRTLAADGSASREDVSNNPLIGRTYQFKTYPKGRDKRLYLLNTILANEGVNLVRAAQIPGGSYKEPPLPNHFSNCVRSSLVQLEPGQIKYSSVKYEKNMHFLMFLTKVHMLLDNAGPTRFHDAPFPSQMFALEDMINVNPLQNISVAYEINKELGIYFKTNKKAKAVTSFQQATVSNNP